MIAFLALVVLLVVFVARRRRRAVRLAGLSSSAPVFSVEPPRRHLSTWKDQAL